MNKNQAREQARLLLGLGGMYWAVVQDLADGPRMKILNFCHTFHDFLACERHQKKGERTLNILRRKLSTWNLRLGMSRPEIEELLGPCAHTGNLRLKEYLKRRPVSDLYQSCIKSIHGTKRNIDRMLSTDGINDLSTLLAIPYKRMRSHDRWCILKILLPLNLNVGMTAEEIRLALDLENEEAR